MSESVLTRKALEALDHHLRYWERIDSSEHFLMVKSFLTTYLPEYALKVHAQKKRLTPRDEEVLEAIAAHWTKAESVAWNYAPTMLLEQHIRDTVLEASESIDPAPLLAEMLPMRQGVMMMPNLASIFNYVAESDREEGAEEMPVRAVAWSWAEDGIIGHPTLGVGPGVDLWLYSMVEDVEANYVQARGHELFNRHPWAKVPSNFIIIDRIPWREGALWREARDEERKREDRYKAVEWLIDPDGVMPTDDHVFRFRKFMLSLWAFMSDRILITPKTHIPRADMRRLQRSGRMAPIPEDGALRIIQLRPVDWIRTDERESDDSAEAPLWSHRWWVRGHPRRLKDGRVIYVKPYIKGPKDRPLVLKNNIVTVNR